MKKVICLCVVLLLILCGCGQEKETETYDVQEFSYAADCAKYENDPGANQSYSVSTEKTKLKTAAQAVELAKKACAVKYDTIAVAYDKDSKIYRVSFSKEAMPTGSQTVYINKDGMIQMILFGE